MMSSSYDLVIDWVETRELQLILPWLHGHSVPIASSFLGSLVDTITFFFLAFAGTGLPWASWALGDFAAKLVMIAVLLYPFKLLVTLFTRGTRSA